MVSVGILIAYGEFSQDFLIITTIVAACAFSFYSYLHWIVRWIGIILHMFIILFIEMPILREIILQLACYQLGFCRGRSSFEQMQILEDIKLSSGSILVEGHISFTWMAILFWRGLAVVVIHYICILTTASLSLKLGIISNKMVELQIEEIVERPAEDSATMFSFVKQQFYQKSLAYTKYEKSKGKKKKNQN